MDESESTQEQYASFLVRLWRGSNAEQDKPNGGWQGEVEHIQSGRRLAFVSAAELWAFLQQSQAAESCLEKGGLPRQSISRPCL